MSVAAALRRKLAARQEKARANYEAYEQWQYQKRFRDEVTDQTERLAAPLVTPAFVFKLGEHGLQSDLGEYLTKVQDDGIAEAERMAAADPANWQLEVGRRRIERSGLPIIEDFTRRYSPNGEVMITSMTLDQSDYIAMQAIVERLSYSLPDGQSSEEILGNYYQLGDPPVALVNLSPCPDAVVNGNTEIPGYDRDRKKMFARIVTFNMTVREELLGTVRAAYDHSLAEQYGGEWLAGRRPEEDRAEATSFIMSQPDLLRQHMAIVQRVFAAEHDRDRIMDLLKPHRYNLAAALAHRRRGQEYASLADAGIAARSNNESYEGDCPTGTLTRASAATALEALSFFTSLNHIDKCVKCIFCKATVDAQTKIGKNPRTNKYTLIYQCLTCHGAIDKKTGERIDVKASAQKLGGEAIWQVLRAPRPRQSAEDHPASAVVRT